MTLLSLPAPPCSAYGTLLLPCCRAALLLACCHTHTHTRFIEREAAQRRNAPSEQITALRKRRGSWSVLRCRRPANRRRVCCWWPWSLRRGDGAIRSLLHASAPGEDRGSLVRLDRWLFSTLFVYVGGGFYMLLFDLSVKVLLKFGAQLSATAGRAP